MNFLFDSIDVSEDDRVFKRWISFGRELFIQRIFARDRDVIKKLVRWIFLNVSLHVIAKMIEKLLRKRCLNTEQLALLLAGEEGFEPPTFGFGDRCAAVAPFPYCTQLSQKEKFEALLSWTSEIKASVTVTDAGSPVPNKAYNRRLKKERSKRLEKVAFSSRGKKDWLQTEDVRIFGEEEDDEEGLERFDQTELRPSHVGIAV